MSRHDDHHPDKSTYVTYDEHTVSRATIDRAIDTLRAASYRTYDEQTVSRDAILKAIARSDTSHTRSSTLRHEAFAWLLAVVVVMVLAVFVVANLVH